MSTLSDPGIELSAAQVADLLAEDPETQLVDVRETYEYDAGRIEGARHIELERLTSQAETIDRERPVVFHCRVGSRSAMAAQAFRAAGYDAYTMTGGLVAWDAQGLPLVPAGGHVASH